MKGSIKIIATVVLLCLSIGFNLRAQSKKADWFRIPGFGPESPLSLTDEQTFIGVVGLAAISYSLAEFVWKGDENLNYYQIRTGMNHEYFWGFRNVYLQNFGVENRVAPWFAIALEANMQEWQDRTPVVQDKKSFGMGFGLMSYFRWYIFGKKRISPFIEYGTGLFYGLSKFPHNGTNFTFNNSTQLGVEYSFKNRNKLRIAYGQFHQSNNQYQQPNPGYDGNGFSIAYSWFWRTSKW